MDEIPIEILEMIFERLPIDQLEECRRVSKKWQFTIDCRMTFDCLVVHRGLPPVNQTFFPTNKKVSLRYCLPFDDFTEEKMKKGIYRRFRRACFYTHFDNSLHFTKRFHLRIYACPLNMRTKLSPFNQLNQLEELHLCSILRLEDCTLSLPNLKTFKLNGGVQFWITLDAPQLVNLSLEKRFHNVKLIHPETIKRFEIWFGYLAAFCQLSFCEYLKSMSSLKRLLIESGNLIFYPELSEKKSVIEFLRDGVEEIHLLGFWKISSEFWQTMKELKEQDKQMKIYLKGLEMDCLRELLDKPPEDVRRNAFLEASHLTTSDQATTYLSNSSALSEKLHFFRVNYSAIEGLVRNTLDLFDPRRLFSVRVVFVSEQVKDELAFGRWLSKLNTLVEIIFDCPMSQHFYSNTLPTSCPTLQGLTLNCVAPLDFSFLLKFKFLLRLDLGSSDYSLVELLFSKLAHFRYVAFYECNDNELERILAVINRRNSFEVYDYKGEYENVSPVKKFETFESLIEFTNQFDGF